ncbi:family 16 glycoside hydrolase [Halobacteriota archaeon]
MVELGAPDNTIITKIVKNPGKPQHIVVSFKHGVTHEVLSPLSELLRESYDGGKTWSPLTDLALQSNGVEDVVISEDSSGKWQYMTDSPDYSYDIEIDPEDSSIIYVAYSPKIFENHSSIWRYSKNQNDWSEIFRVEDSRGVTSLAIDKLDPNKFYAGVIGEKGTVYASSNKGQTWNVLNEDLSFTTIWGHSQLQINPIDKSTVYAGTWGGGSYKTTDGGESWTMLDEDHTFSPVCLAISSKNPSIIYACDRTAPKIHKSTDGGETWTEYYDFGGEYMLSSAVAIDPDNPDRIYASAFKPPMAHEGGLVVITSGQATPIGEGLPRSVLEIEIDPTNKNIIYVTTHIHGVYKSEDAGITWEKLDDQNNGLPRIGVYDIDIDPSNNNILYATALCGELPGYMIPPPTVGIQNIDPDGKCGVYKSTDAGENWELILETISEARGIDVDTKNNNNLYVADMMGGIWVSNDAGQTWRQENNGLGSISMTSVKIKDDYIYASTQGSGVYSGIINNDGSITWDKTRSNKPKAYVYKIQVEVDPTNSDRIYASSYPGGLLRSDDGGEHWNDKNFLTPSIKVDDPLNQGYYRFDINSKNPEIVWMGVFGQGMFVSYDGMDFNMFASGNDNAMRGKHVTSVKTNPTNPDEVYAGTQGEGVFVTKDGGKTWEEMNDGLKTLNILSLKVVDIEWPPLGDDFEDGNADGWKSDGGWSAIQKDGNYVLQGTGHNWISSGSESWSDYTFESRVKLFDGSVHVNYRVSGSNRYAIGINSGSVYLMRTLDGVHTNLKNVDMQFHNSVWYDIKIVGKGNNIKVYVNGVLKIDYTDNEPLLNGRIAFESLEDQIHVDNVVITIDSTDSEIYAGTAGYGIYKFNHANQKWQNLGRSFGGGWWSPWDRRMYQFSSIIFDPDVPGKVYYGHFPSGFFVSDDNGNTWEDSSLRLGNDGIFSLSMHPHDHNILFAGTYNGVAKSVDRGRTWELKSEGMPSEQWPYTVAIDDDNPYIMYASTKNGQNKGFCNRNDFCGVVMKSVDGGESWFKIMNGLNDRSEFYTLLIYPSNHDVLFLSTNEGVYLSRDAGDNWEAINSGLPSKHNQVRDNVADNLALTPDNRYLILGLMDYGVWKADLSELNLSS